MQSDELLEFDGFMDRRDHLFARLTNCNASGKIGHVCPKRGWALFDYDEITYIFHSGLLSPACFKALFKFPGGTSMLGFPAP